MPHTVHDPQAFFVAILARISSSTGKQVGLAEAPPVNDYDAGYCVVDPLVDELTEGGLDDPTQIAVWAWQVRCISSGAAGAQWLQKKVRTALQGHIPTVTGVGTTPIQLDQGSGVERDDSLSGNPTLFFSHDRFIAFTSI